MSLVTERHHQTQALSPQYQWFTNGLSSVANIDPGIRMKFSHKCLVWIQLGYAQHYYCYGTQSPVELLVCREIIMWETLLPSLKTEASNVTAVETALLECPCSADTLALADSRMSFSPRWSFFVQWLFGDWTRLGTTQDSSSSPRIWC